MPKESNAVKEGAKPEYRYVSISFDDQIWDVMERNRGASDKGGGRQLRDRSAEVRAAQRFYYAALGLLDGETQDEVIQATMLDLMRAAMSGTEKVKADKKSSAKTSKKKTAAAESAGESDASIVASRRADFWTRVEQYLGQAKSVGRAK